MDRNKFVAINQFRYTHTPRAGVHLNIHIQPMHSYIVLYRQFTITKAEEECALYIVKQSYLNNPPLVVKKVTGFKVI